MLRLQQSALGWSKLQTVHYGPLYFFHGKVSQNAERWGTANRTAQGGSRRRPSLQERQPGVDDPHAPRVCGIGMVRTPTADSVEVR